MVAVCQLIIKVFALIILLICWLFLFSLVDYYQLITFTRNAPPYGRKFSAMKYYTVRWQTDRQTRLSAHYSKIGWLFKGMLMTPDLLRLESRPLADDAMAPGTPRDADNYFNNISAPVENQLQQKQHPLSETVRARYADKNARHAVVSSSMRSSCGQCSTVSHDELLRTKHLVLQNPTLRQTPYKPTNLAFPLQTYYAPIRADSHTCVLCSYPVHSLFSHVRSRSVV